jgi:uroporphyrinogen III methyltransferase/synthase
VERTFDRIEALGLDARAFGGARVGVIGPKTAKALRCRGIVCDAQAREFTGEGLAGAITVKAGQRVLLLRALVAREALPDHLRGLGAQVDVVPAYETRMLSAARAKELATMLRRGDIDVVMFTSSSTVDAVVAALGERAAECLAKATVASIGPITSETARGHGVEVHVTAEIFTVDGLLDALEAHLATRLARETSNA